MPIALDLPYWMVERIVQNLSEYPYTDAPEIVHATKEQTKTC
jgi:hypothetical protein